MYNVLEGIYHVTYKLSTVERIRGMLSITTEILTILIYMEFLQYTVFAIIFLGISN